MTENNSRDARELFGFAAEKAGMNNLDKERINNVILEASVGSAFYEDEQRKAQAAEAQTQELLRKWERFHRLSDSEQKHSETETRQYLLNLAASRPKPRYFVHVDMDMFYAAVEMLDNPSLRDIPFAVGGEGMLSTSNYVARKFGVRAGMPGFIARKLCPELTIVRNRMWRYAEVSKIFQGVLRKYDPDCAVPSFDEAYMELSAYLNACGKDSFDDCAAAVVEMRKEVYEATGLTCSAGIGPSRMISKICSDVNKPNGQKLVRVEEVDAFLEPLEVRKIPGVGKRREKELSCLGIKTCGQIIEMATKVNYLFTPIGTDFLFRAALGLDSGSSKESDERKSVGRERTFRATADVGTLQNIVRNIASRISGDLVEKELFAGKLVLKVKGADFGVQNYSVALPQPTQMQNQLERVGLELLKQHLKTRRSNIRLLGLRCIELSKSNSGGGSGTVSTLQDIWSVAQERNRRRDARRERRIRIKRGKLSKVLAQQVEFPIEDAK